MKKMLLLIPVLFLIIGFSVKKYTDDKIRSVLQQIHLSEDDAKSYMFSSISGPSFYIPGTRELKKFAENERAAIILLAGEYIKEYTSSPEFLQRYQEYKESKKPSPPEPPKPVSELKEQQRTAMVEAIKNMEKVKASMPADQQASFDEGIASMKEQLKELDNPDNAMFSADMGNMMQQGYEQQVVLYNQRLEEIEREYPESPAPMIKNWLQKFLDETKDVDYNAAVAEEKGKKVFVNSAYEYKSPFWKLCYRAGKETVDAARSFAQTWLNELN